jgi:hypothetical protein
MTQALYAHMNNKKKKKRKKKSITKKRAGGVREFKLQTAKVKKSFFLKSVPANSICYY